MRETPILQAAKSCLSQLNKLSFNQPLLGWFALGLASLATDRQGLFCYPTKERRQTMSRLTPGEQARRDAMFQDGLLWCAGHKQFELAKGFRKYNPKTRSHHTNYGYRFYCSVYELNVQNPNRADRQSKFAKERNLDLKKFWVDLAGGKCQRCGFSEFTSALEFHHVYPALKAGTPSVLIFCNNREKTWKELDKCCLLCSICHRAHKAREWQAEFIKRDGLGWTVGDPLPLDDSRYETEKPPKYQQASMPIFNYEQKASQLTLFESRPAYNVEYT